MSKFLLDLLTFKFSVELVLKRVSRMAFLKHPLNKLQENLFKVFTINLKFSFNFKSIHR